MLTTEITTNTADFQRRGNGIFCHYQLFNHSMYNKEGSVKRVTLPPPSVILLREALQKYPEQSFAQKFSLCNRQKFSGRKIKEGF